MNDYSFHTNQFHNRYHKNSYHGIEPNLIQSVRRAVGRVACKVPLTAEDREDLEQDLTFALLGAIQLHVPEKSSRATFIRTILDNLSCNYFRNRFAQCRDVRIAGESLNQDCLDAEDELNEPIEFITESDAYPWKTGISVYEHTDIRHDLAIAMAALSPRQQEIAIAILKGNTIAEAARELGISPSTIYSSLSLIKRQFLEFGMESYIA